jgi:hypothetical protein
MRPDPFARIEDAPPKGGVDLAGQGEDRRTARARRND